MNYQYLIFIDPLSLVVKRRTFLFLCEKEISTKITLKFQNWQWRTRLFSECQFDIILVYYHRQRKRLGDCKSSRHKWVGVWLQIRKIWWALLWCKRLSDALAVFVQPKLTWPQKPPKETNSHKRNWKKKKKCWSWAPSFIFFSLDLGLFPDDKHFHKQQGILNLG